MSEYVEFYTGDKLCQSIDFLYASSMCGGNSINRKIDSLDNLDSGQRFFITSSIVSMPNLSPEQFAGDLPQFEGTYILDRLSAGMIDALRADKAMFVIDYSGETATVNEPVFAQFHRELESRGIPARNIIFLNQNYNFKAAYEAWCQTTGFQPVNPLAYNHHLYQFSGTVNINEPNERERRLAVFKTQMHFKSARARIFTCLNNIPRVHRYALASYLKVSPYDALGWLSCLGQVPPEYEDGFAKDVLDMMGTRRLSRSEFSRFRRQVPLEADEPLATSRGTLAGTLGNPTMYMSTFVSFVTESEFDSGISLRVTEKVYKPIANLQPFLLFSSPHVLPLLHQYGFRSFAPVIDESYDAVVDPLERLARLFDLVDWICTRSPKQLVELTEAVSETLLHNYNWFWDAPSRYANDPIHEQLRSFAKIS